MVEVLYLTIPIAIDIPLFHRLNQNRQVQTVYHLVYQQVRNQILQDVVAKQ